MRCPAPLEVQSYVDAELPESRAALVHEHLRRCRACQELARELSTTADLLHVLADVPARSPGSISVAARAGAGAPHRWWARYRWVLLPAAASLLLTTTVAWRHFFPIRGDQDFISIFIQAHRQAAASEEMPEPCDFGLGGRWP